MSDNIELGGAQMGRRSLLRAGAVLGGGLAATLLSGCRDEVVPLSLADSRPLTMIAAQYSDPKTAQFWAAFATRYRERTGLDLEVEVISWNDLDRVSSRRIAEGNAPDILNLNAFASYAARGLLYGEKEVLATKLRSEILPAFRQAGSFEGELYGFPDLSSARALFCNKDLFERAGVAAAPTTWDELIDAAERISDLGAIGYGLPLGPEEAQGEFSIWIFNNGGDWKRGGAWTINSEANVESLVLLRKLTEDGLTQPDPARTNRGPVFDLFRRGQVGMALGMTSLGKDLDRERQVRYEVVPFPHRTGDGARGYAISDFLMAFRRPDNLQAIQAFFDLYYEVDQVNALVAQEGYLPVTRLGIEYFASDPSMRVYLEALPDAKMAPTSDPHWDEVKVMVQKNLGRAMTEDPRSVLDELQQVALKDYATA